MKTVDRAILDLLPLALAVMVPRTIRPSEMEKYMPVMRKAVAAMEPLPVHGFADAMEALPRLSLDELRRVRAAVDIAIVIRSREF